MRRVVEAAARDRVRGLSVAQLQQPSVFSFLYHPISVYHFVFVSHGLVVAVPRGAVVAM
eukprot:SAG11_NODE_25341_length_360_cov_0.720307_2_plen_58_part_01